MNRLMVAIIAVLLTAGISFAENNTAAAPAPKINTSHLLTKAPAAADPVTKLTGKISGVVPANAAQGQGASISVMLDNGQMQKLALNPNAKIFDADMKPITLAQLKSDSKANIDYKMSAKGEKQAVSIHLLR